MSFTSPPIWKNQGVEPPEELKNNGFTAGYKPPASYFNWFWNRVSNCISELQGAIDTKAPTMEQFTITATGWVLDSSTGYYKQANSDERVTEADVVNINLNVDSLEQAESCGLLPVTESYNEGFYLYSTSVPTVSMVGTLIIEKGGTA